MEIACEVSPALRMKKFAVDLYELPAPSSNVNSALNEPPSSGVPLIIQLSSSTSTQQAEAASLETKTPHIGANQSADTLTTKLDNPYFVLAGMPASIQFKTLLAFTQKVAP